MMLTFEVEMMMSMSEDDSRDQHPRLREAIVRVGI
jgi:hypothetical protein